MRLKLFFSIVASLLLVTLFQNCGSAVSFSPSSAAKISSKSGELTVVENEDPSLGDNTEVPSDDEDGDKKGPKDKEVCDDEDESPSAPGAAEFICILEGNGKSVRLGYIDNQLIENGDTPNTVCMTQSACLGIVDKKFVVKSAEFRGFCKNGGGGSVSLSNDQISDLIEAID